MLGDRHYIIYKFTIHPDDSLTSWSQSTVSYSRLTYELCTFSKSGCEMVYMPHKALLNLLSYDIVHSMFGSSTAQKRNTRHAKFDPTRIRTYNPQIMMTVFHVIACSNHLPISDYKFYCQIPNKIHHPHYLHTLIIACFHRPYSWTVESLNHKSCSLTRHLAILEGHILRDTLWPSAYNICTIYQNIII